MTTGRTTHDRRRAASGRGEMVAGPGRALVDPLPDLRVSRGSLTWVIERSIPLQSQRLHGPFQTFFHTFALPVGRRRRRPARWVTATAGVPLNVGVARIGLGGPSRVCKGHAASLRFGCACAAVLARPPVVPRQTRPGPPLALPAGSSGSARPCKRQAKSSRSPRP